MMSLRCAAAILVLFVIVSVPTLCQAREFSIVGPRAMALGGAYVAVCRDASAMYWNPAALALAPQFELDVVAGQTVSAPGKILDKIRDLGDFDVSSDEVNSSREYVEKIASLLKELARQEKGLLSDLHAACYLKVGRIGISLDEVSFVSLSPQVDLENLDVGAEGPSSISKNRSSVTGMLLRPRELSISYARSVLPFSKRGSGRGHTNLLLGTNVKIVNARAFYVDKTVWDYGLSGDTVRDVLREFKRKNSFAGTKFSADFGALLMLGSRARIGLVARNINEPDFSYGTSDGAKGKLKLNAQYRLGFAVWPTNRWLIAVDTDLAKNDTGVEGYSSQTVSFGSELTFLHGALALRAGIFKNVAENQDPFITTGFGVNLRYFTLDVATGVCTSGDEEYSFSACIGAKL